MLSPRTDTVEMPAPCGPSKGVVDICRPRGFESIELHRGSKITQEYPRHWHDEIYLCAVTEGTAYLECPGGPIFTPPETLTLVPPGQVHANRKLQCTFRCIFMEFRAMQSAVEESVERTVPGFDFRTTVIGDPQTLSNYLQLHRSLESPNSALKRDHALLVFLHGLLTRHSAANVAPPPEGNEDPAVRQAKRYLDEHYAENVPLHELARLTRLSPYHLNRSFCRKVGMPPHAYQLQMRIARAKSALRTGSSIVQVAMASGFADQSHFTRVFKRLVGDTPAQFWSNRKNVQDSPEVPL